MISLFARKPAVSVTPLTDMRIDPFAVNLDSSQHFQEWYLQGLTAGVSPQNMVAGLTEIESLTASLRALSIAYWAKLPQYDTLLKSCLTNGNVVAAETAKGFAVFRRSIETMRQGGPQMRTRLAEMHGALAWSQRLLADLPQDDLTMEAQIGTLMPLCLLLVQEGRYEEAIQTASQALFLAEQLQAPVSIARARNTLIACTANAGRINTTAEMVWQERAQAYRYDPLYTEMELAAALFRLGNFEEASSVLNVLIATHQGALQERALDFLHRMQALWGVGGVDSPIYPTPKGSTPTPWIMETLRSLVQAYATPRESRGAEERAAHFAGVIEGCQNVVHNGESWLRLFTQWARATAHMGRGEWIDAVGIMEHAEQADPEWLDIRVLILGLGLELSLCWQAPDTLSTAKYEHHLRLVFAQAAELRFASPEGLARLLQRWHPTAAAYLALVPQPVLACTPAAKLMLKVGQHNFIDELNLPPVYACDLMLRSLDFDLRRDFVFVQGDAGASRTKKKGMMQTCGAVQVWQLPVSAVKIAYGMMRHPHLDYQARAQAVVQTYGTRPLTAALYPMMGTVEAIEQHTKELLNGYLTTKGFAARLNALTH
jgi:tetratricopeptide (TPR) repeat protein